MEDDRPSISVITIVKDDERLLPRAIESVLQQSVTDFEYLIVNDGSTDGTKDIIDAYATNDIRLKPRHMPYNIGRAMARNTGLEVAKGRYIFFLDSDDYLPFSAFKDLFDVAEKENADIVYGHIKAFDQKTGQWRTEHYTDSIINQERHQFCLDQHLDLVNDHSIIGRLYRREMLNKNNIRFSTLRKNGEDLLFAFYASYYAKRLSMVPQKIVYYYNWGNYLSTANEDKLFDARDNVLETIKFAIKNGSPALKVRMIRKGAMFAGDLKRAQKVYQGDEIKFKSYLETLVPLVFFLSANILRALPPYYRSFARALIANDFKEAYSTWLDHYNSNFKKDSFKEQQKANHIKKQIEKKKNNDSQINELKKRSNMLRNENVKLAYKLDGIYQSRCWRFTVPLRFINRLISRRFASTHPGD